MSPSEIRGLPGYLFDLDGTLIDTAPDICAAVNHALNRFGFDSVGEGLVRHWVGHGGRACIEHAVERALLGSEAASGIDGSPAGSIKAAVADKPNPGPSVAGRALVDEMLACFLEHYRAHIANASQPYPGVVDVLRALRERGAKLAVVTNKRLELTRRLLDALNLTTAFDTIIGGDTAPNPKPAPDPVHLACENIALTAADVLFVGDSQTDVDAARAAGCRVVCVPYGYNHGIAPEQLGADAVVGSLNELVSSGLQAPIPQGNVGFCYTN